jgi:hypothetical protein
MEDVRAELLSVVHQCAAHDVRYRETRLVVSSVLVWVRISFKGVANPLNKRLRKLDTHSRRESALRREKELATIARSLYPLFALRTLLPEDVAWIIVVLAHWGACIQL